MLDASETVAPDGIRSLAAAWPPVGPSRSRAGARRRRPRRRRRRPRPRSRPPASAGGEGGSRSPRSPGSSRSRRSGRGGSARRRRAAPDREVGAQRAGAGHDVSSGMSTRSRRRARARLRRALAVPTGTPRAAAASGIVHPDRVTRLDDLPCSWGPGPVPRGAGACRPRHRRRPRPWMPGPPAVPLASCPVSPGARRYGAGSGRRAPRTQSGTGTARALPPSIGRIDPLTARRHTVTKVADDVLGQRPGRGSAEGEVVHGSGVPPEQLGEGLAVLVGETPEERGIVLGRGLGADELSLYTLEKSGAVSGCDG